MTLEEWLEKTGNSQRLLAQRLGVTQGAISQWVAKGVPPARVVSVVAATEGEVGACEIAPDLYPPGFEFPQSMLCKALCEGA